MARPEKALEIFWGFERAALLGEEGFWKTMVTMTMMPTTTTTTTTTMERLLAQNDGFYPFSFSLLLLVGLGSALLLLRIRENQVG